MAGERLGFWDYVKAAFHLKAPVPLLGLMPVNKLLLGGFAILGLGNPGFWLLGIAYEVGYLLWMASNTRFQNLVRGSRMARVQETWAEREQNSLDVLDKNGRDRYLRLADVCQRILRTDGGAAAASGLAGLQSEGLNQILLIYLKLLVMRQRTSETIARTSRKELEDDLKRLEERLASEPEASPVHRSLQGTLEVQQARLENLKNSVENLKYTETELDRIEKQVSLISEQMAASKSPEQWSVTLDGVVKSVQGTSRWMADNSELLETVEAPPAPVGPARPAPARPAQRQ